MPQFGGYSPFPRRWGGGRPTLQSITESILTQLGTSYDTVDKVVINGNPPLVWIRAQAFARCVWGAWEQNQRLANQWDALRITDFLSRWEKIYALYPSPSDSTTTRLARIGVAMSRVGFSAGSAVYDTCKAYLGPVFLNLVFTSSASAVVWTPLGWTMGSHPIAPTDPDWYSTVAHVVVLTQQPATMLDDEYAATIGSVKPALDSILPAWVTFDVCKDGTQVLQFILDDPHNLDLERFA